MSGCAFEAREVLCTSNPVPRTTIQWLRCVVCGESRVGTHRFLTQLACHGPAVTYIHSYSECGTSKMFVAVAQILLINMPSGGQ